MLGKSGKPHKPIRSSCKHCKRTNHNHIKRIGNSDRFHGHGSFCRTHSGTKIGRIYCRRKKNAK